MLPTQGLHVRPPPGELRSHMPVGWPKKQTNRQTTTMKTTKSLMTALKTPGEGPIICGALAPTTLALFGNKLWAITSECFLAAALSQMFRLSQPGESTQTPWRNIPFYGGRIRHGEVIQYLKVDRQWSDGEMISISAVIFQSSHSWALGQNKLPHFPVQLEEI